MEVAGILYGFSPSGRNLGELLGSVLFGSLVAIAWHMERISLLHRNTTLLYSIDLNIAKGKYQFV